MKRGAISSLLRSFGLIYFTDWLRYYLQRYKNHKLNNAFKKEYPEVKLPPDYLLYESFQLNYSKYYFGGRDTAKWLTNHFEKHISLKDRTILDWGCGPGRTIRHLPDLIDNGCTFYGTDYNARSIAWCKENLSGIDFNNNSLEASLPYEDNFFDIIYGISIFTHFSAQLHYDWYNELYRVLKPGGILFLTTQGENFKAKMTQSEILSFENEELVIRGKVKEGHRTYSAFHPKGFMEKLFSNAEILAHIETPPSGNAAPPQDIWVVQKV